MSDNPYLDSIQARTVPDPQAQAPQPAAGDNPYLESMQARQQATSNLAGVAPVPPPAAATAIQAGPEAGIPPAVGMRTSDQVKAAQLQAQQQQALQDPNVRSFVNTADPAHVAAAQQSLPDLVKLSQQFPPSAEQVRQAQQAAVDFADKNPNDFAGARAAYDRYRSVSQAYDSAHPQPVNATIQGFAAYASTWFNSFSPFEDWANAYKDTWQAAQKIPFGRGDFGANAQATFSTLMTALNIPIAPFAAPTGKGMYAAYKIWEPYNPTLLSGVPTADQEATQAAAQAIIGSVIPVGGGRAAEEAGILHDFGSGPKGAVPEAGPPHLGPDGYATTPEGFVADEQGRPVYYPSQREAGRFAFGSERADTGQKFDMATSDVEGYYHAKETGRVPEPVEDVPPVGAHEGVDAVRAEVATMDAERVSQLQDMIAQTPLHGQSPETMAEFLKGVAPTEVSVPGDKLTDLMFQGHDLSAIGTPQQFYDASEAGENIKVPLGQYLSATVGQPFAQDLNAASVFRSDGISAEDAKELKAKGEEEPKLVPGPTEPKDTTSTTYQDALGFYKGSQDYISADHATLTQMQKDGQLTKDNQQSWHGLLDAKAELEAAKPKDVPLPPDIPPEAQGYVNSLAADAKGLTEQVFKSHFLGQLFDSPKALGLSQGQFRNWSVKVEAAKANLEEKILDRTFKQVKKYLSQEYKDEYGRQYAAALDEVMSSPAVKAYYSLKEGRTEDSIPNLIKENGKPVRWHHGSKVPTIGEPNNPWKVQGNHDVISFSASGQFSDAWAAGHQPGEGKTVYFTNISAKHVADYKNPKDVEKAAQWFIDHPNVAGDKGYGGVPKEQLVKLLSGGRWRLWETPEMWKDCGFDAAYVTESGMADDTVRNIAVANPEQIHWHYRPDQSVPVNTKMDFASRDSLDPALRERLPKGLFSADGEHMDLVAEQLGYSSGQKMLEDIANLEDARKQTGLSFKNLLEVMQKDLASKAAEAKLGYSLSKADMARAAEELAAEHLPQIEDFLTDELSHYAKTAGLPFSKQFLEDYAAKRFAAKTVKDALNIKELQRYVYKGGLKIEAALTKGDYITAFQHKQAQFIHFLQLKEAYAFTREYAKTDRALTSVAKKPIVKGMDQDYRNQLRSIAKQLGYSVKTGKWESVEAATKGVSVEDFALNKRKEGYEPVYVPIIGVGKDGLKGVSVSEFRGYAQMIDSFKTLGRDEQKVFAQRDAAELTSILSMIKTNADIQGRVHLAGDLHTLRGKMQNEPGFLAKLTGISIDPSAASRATGAGVTRVETMLYYMDKTGYGPFMKYVIGPLQEGKYYKADMIKTFSDKFKAFVAAQPEGWTDSLTNKIDVPELTFGIGQDQKPVNWLQYKNQAIMAARYLGERSALDKLLKGFGWDENTFRGALNRVLTKADWDYVQHLWDMHEHLLPETQELSRVTTGLAFKTEPKLAVPTPHGTYKGGHLHVSYDHSAIGEFRNEAGEMETVKDPTILTMSNLFGSHYRTAVPPNAYTLSRTNFAAPTNLDHATLAHEYESIIHDLAYRKGLIQANKILKQPAVAQALNEALGPEYQAEINHWLMDIARQSSYEQKALSFWASHARGFRRRFLTLQIGYNVLTLAKHGGIAMFHVNGELGTGTPGSGLAAFAKAMSAISKPDQHWADFVDKNSGEVRTAKMNMDRDINEILTKLYRDQGFISTVQYNAFTMFAAVKQWEAKGTWLAKYWQLLDKGYEHQQAIELANKAVRDTQGAGSPVDLPALWRGDGSFISEVGKLMTSLLSGFENTTTNRMWLMKKGVEKSFRDEGWAGARRNFPQLSTNAWAYIIGPALFVTLLEEGIKEDFDPAHAVEAFMENGLKSLLGGSIPMGNTVASLPRAFVSKGHDVGSDPILDTMKTVVETGVDTGQFLTGHGDRVEDRWVQHLIDNTGLVTGFPVKPVERAAQFSWDLSQNHVQDHGLVGDVAEGVRGILFGSTPAQARKK